MFFFELELGKIIDVGNEFLNVFNAVASFTGAVTTFRANEGLTVTGRRKSEPASDKLFGQRIHIVKDVHENHQLSFFEGDFFSERGRKARPVHSTGDAVRYSIYNTYSSKNALRDNII